ncbi:uncharacterized protein [Typha latifolia]|uniref:uncharacterized protein isoform X3 n=1 Tax=Typha latifolia TaxID=4733 RepID=UPI003C2D22B7
MAASSSNHHVINRFSRRCPRGGEAPMSAGLVTSTSKIYISSKAFGINFNCKGVCYLNHQKYYHCISTKKGCLRYVLSENYKDILSPRWLECKKLRPSFHRARRMMREIPLASPDDGVTVNGIPQTTSSSDMEQMRVELDQTLQSEELSSGLIQAIHDAARAIELAILEHSSSKSPWFSKAWLGVDKNAWIKTLSYQAAVYSLLQATIEISSRGDARDRDINVLVQRSLVRLCAPLERIIQDELSMKQNAAYEWFWSYQLPSVMTTFVNLFEKDVRFSAATRICCKGESTSSPIASDISLLMLALSCLAAITKLGSTKVSCQQFFPMVSDITGRFMDMLLDFVPISKAYQSMKDIGLRREFLSHFGPRAATGRFPNDHGFEEISFWIDLIQKQLQRAIDRERIWSRLTTCESIEVLEKDLAIFGFFIALGRRTQSHLSSNGFTAIDDPIKGIIRYLIGGSVLYYPQLSSISSYQLYVEVVCEELEWLPFYQSNLSDASPDSNGKEEGIHKREVISKVLSVCSYWITSFIKYSQWLENPSNIKAARFLSRGYSNMWHSMLSDCMKELDVTKNRKRETAEYEGQLKPEAILLAESELDSFDKALESVEEAMVRLENLLQELHLSSSNPGKEHLKAACSDLEKIRKLKKEAEFLEASFRAKAESLEQVDSDDGQLSTSGGQEHVKIAGEISNASATSAKQIERVDNKRRGFWSFLVQRSTRKSEPGLPTTDRDADVIKKDNQDELNDIHRFELLRHQLIELEKRVQGSMDHAENEETDLTDDKNEQVSATLHNMLVPASNKDDVIAKSMEKIKETTTDVWQGTQLLAIDVAAASVLLKRALTGDELTEKERKAVQRTMTDLASVVPIGILMLLPVTAVGHAAMLAFIQRYVPALIPSTYAPERLDLLRQLEKVKEMEITDVNTDEVTEAVGFSNDNSK